MAERRYIADQNDDGAVTPADYSAFVANYNAGDLTADCDQDGVLTQADFIAWLEAYRQGDDGPFFDEDPDIEEWVSMVPTDLTQYQTVYCCSSSGDDTNQGTQAEPVKTLDRAIAIANSKYNGSTPVALLLKAGDSFTGRLRNTGWLAGTSATKPALLATYGGTSRATITSDSGELWGNNTTPSDKTRIDNCVIANIHFRPQSSKSGYAVAWNKHGIRNAVFENCIADDFNIGMSFVPSPRRPQDTLISGIVLRRCIIRNNNLSAGSTSGRDSHGLFITDVKGFTIDECIIDGNGGRDGFSSIFGHNIYCRGNTTGFVMVRSVCSRGDATGAQIRPGGKINNNIFFGNPVSVVIAGEGGEVKNNIIVDMTDIDDSTRRGWGIDWNNCVRPVTISGNIIGAHSSGGDNTRGIAFGGADGPARVGTVSGNYIGSVKKPLSHGVPGSGQFDDADIDITGNFFNGTDLASSPQGTFPNAYWLNGGSAEAVSSSNVDISGNSSITTEPSSITDYDADFLTTLVSDPFSITSAIVDTIYPAYLAEVSA